MPYIAVNTAAKLSQEQTETIKSELGKLIEIIPGKSETGLLIDFSDGRPMYKAGAKMESCAFIDVRIYGKADFEDKKRFVEQVFKMMEHVLGLKESEIYLNFFELDEWGSAGTYKTTR